MLCGRENLALFEESQTSDQPRERIHFQGDGGTFPRTEKVDDRIPADVPGAQRFMPVASSAVVAPMHVNEMAPRLLQPRAWIEMTVHMGMCDVEAQTDAGIFDGLEKLFEDGPVGLPMVLQANGHGIRRAHRTPEDGASIDHLLTVGRAGDQGIESQVKNRRGALQSRRGLEIPFDTLPRDGGDLFIGAVEREIEERSVKSPDTAKTFQFPPQFLLGLPPLCGIVQRRTAHERGDFHPEIMTSGKRHPRCNVAGAKRKKKRKVRLTVDARREETIQSFLSTGWRRDEALPIPPHNPRRDRCATKRMNVPPSGDHFVSRPCSMA